MTPFKELQVLADAIRDQKKRFCSVTVEHYAYTASGSELRYILYIDGDKHRYYKTVQEILSAMQDIINPTADTGILLEEL